MTRDRGWNYLATSQGSHQKLEEAKKDSCLDPSEGA